MEETGRTEKYFPSSLPLHLQSSESNNSSRPRGDKSDGMSKFADRRHRGHPKSSMSKRLGNSSVNNGYGCGDLQDSRLIQGYYSSNESASMPSLSSSSTAENKKYIRRKTKQTKCHEMDRLFLTMVALVILSCSFAMYSTTRIFDSTSIIIDRPIDGFGQRSRASRPRVIGLQANQFDSYQDNPIRIADNHLATMVSLPTNVSVVLFGDLSSEEIISEPEADSTANIEAPRSENTREEKQCLPMAKWMTASFPNCNSIHEIDMNKGVMTQTYEDEDDLKFLGQGWFRDTWKYVNENLEGSPAVVLKTLRIEREFIDEYFDLHRRDAVAMERLTFSPYVVNVHGYCGQSAINELAEGIMDGKIMNLEKLNRRLRGKEKDPNVLFLKLQLATKVSIGLAHIHNVHISEEVGGRSKSIESLLNEHTESDSIHSTTGFGQSIATMAHYDINPRNIAIMAGGNPKLNDFNIAEFLTYDPKTNQTCGFRSRLHEPWWRAPEEMDLSHETFVDEKVDVYALGEVLFHILTTHGPRGKMKKYRMDEVRALVKKGIPPDMWEPYASDEKLRKNPIVKAFLTAMDLCFEMDPKKRGTSIQVARIFYNALKNEEDPRREEK